MPAHRPRARRAAAVVAGACAEAASLGDGDARSWTPALVLDGWTPRP